VITYRQEVLRYCRHDIEALSVHQWRETGDRGIKCEPLWEIYEALERAGCLVLIVARQDGRSIGYLTGSVYPHPNSRHHKIGSLPTYFAEHRPGRGLIVKSLIRHGIACAFEKGAWKVIIRTEYDHSAGRIIEALGGQPKAIEYTIARTAIPACREAIHA
jgi:hypothetical protein